MNDYRFGDMVDVVAATKRGLSADAPVHLFGAGHPMMFALAAALGCDLFDSAAYALYARDDRYLTVRGTQQFDDLDYFPCSCPVCAEYAPDEVRALDRAAREEELAAHNLHVTFAEIRRIKQAVRAGDLLELVETRARSHPAMLDGYRALLDHADQLEREDPASKGTFFYVSSESARRPEVRRHRERITRVDAPDELLLTEGAEVSGYDETWSLVPPFGPVPPALAQTYPLTAETPDRVDDDARAAAAETVSRFAAENPGTDLTVAHYDWPNHVCRTLPEGVDQIDLAEWS